jgi:hypothetical protein
MIYTWSNDTNVIFLKPVLKKSNKKIIEDNKITLKDHFNFKKRIINQEFDA